MEAPVASYIQIDTALVNISSPTIQGTASNKITDIWLYVDNQFQGAFPLGHLIPVAGSGNKDIQLFAGIKNNGISDTRLPYHFLKGVDVTVNLTANQTSYLKPKFSYQDFSHFWQIEGFEGPGMAVSTSSTSTSPCFTVNKSTNPGNVFEGNYSMCMTMTDAHNYAEVRTTAMYPLPIYGAVVYMELNYSINQPIDVGVFCPDGSERPILTLNPSDGWNKIYIRLTDVVSQQPTYTGYGVYISAVKQTTNPQIYIDNFKLISE